MMNHCTSFGDTAELYPTNSFFQRSKRKYEDSMGMEPRFLTRGWPHCVRALEEPPFVAMNSAGNATAGGPLSLKYSQEPNHIRMPDATSYEQQHMYMRASLMPHPQSVFAQSFPPSCVLYPAETSRLPISWSTTSPYPSSCVQSRYPTQQYPQQGMNTYPTMTPTTTMTYSMPSTREQFHREFTTDTHQRPKKARLVEPDQTENLSCQDPSPRLEGNHPRNFSRALVARIGSEDIDFLDKLGYGTWTVILSRKIPSERRMMVELMRNLFDRPDEGYFINEFFGARHGQEDHEMCDEYFSQCLILAEFRISAFSVPKRNEPGQFNTTFDTPELYTKVSGYFDPMRRPMLPLTGKGGGRKIRTGSPYDFQEGVHYFQTRTKAVSVLTEKKFAKMSLNR